MKKLHMLLFSIASLTFLAGCGPYVSQLERTIAQKENYTLWLNHVDSLPKRNDNIMYSYFGKQVKQICKQRRLKDANVEVLMQLSATKNKPDSGLISFLNKNWDLGYFVRTFEMDSSSMFYRFDKPNKQGLGIAYISDRYPQGYLDEQTALSPNYIPELQYVFPRVYFIRSNKLNILSGDIDLTDRKEFTGSISDDKKDAHFEKIFTYRKNNNDIVFDQSYHFDFVRYEDAVSKWKNTLDSAMYKTDDMTKFSDVVNFTDYQTLKSIIAKNKSLKAMLVYVDTAANKNKNEWFFAGTLNEFNQWEANYTGIKDTIEIQRYIENDIPFKVSTKLYLREHSPEKTPEGMKGKIIGSIKAGEEITIIEKKLIPSEKNGYYYVWLKKNLY